jgi:3-hydroxyacyl-CoA dehydrogenase
LIASPLEVAMVERVAVVGAGLMGHGIAQVFALSGFRTRLQDVSPERLQGALRAVEADLALLVEEAAASQQEAEAALGRIEATPELEAAVAGADLVVEAIPEVLAAKQELFERLGRLAGPRTILASNTSTLPITRIAERSRAAGRVVLTHFFNPAHLVPLVEVLPHPSAPPEVLEATLDLLRRIGKRPVRLRREVPGFIANRLQAAMVREAFHLLEQGVADAEDIDVAVTEGPGFRWPFLGPLAIADYGGLDVWRKVLENLAPELGQSTAAPAAVVERVERGHLGTKTDQGIYSYRGASVPELLRARDRRLIRLARLKARKD